MCQLYFGEIYDIYWARVRAAEGSELSPWVYSNELQPYRDSKDQGAPSTTSLLLLGGLMGREVLGEVGKVERNRGGEQGEGLGVERGDGGGDAVEMKTPQAIRNVGFWRRL